MTQSCYCSTVRHVINLCLYCTVKDHNSHNRDTVKEMVGLINIIYGVIQKLMMEQKEQLKQQVHGTVSQKVKTVTTQPEEVRVYISTSVEHERMML